MVLVAMRSEDCDLMSAILQPHCCIDDQSFGSPYAKIWVEEHDVLFSSSHIEYHFCIVVDLFVGAPASCLGVTNSAPTISVSQ